MGVSNLISLLGGVALFLFGMSLMGDSLKKVAGNRLEVVLYRLSSNPLKGVLLGTGVTAVIQSSSATSVMVVGFVNSGMMKLRQAISIILGAILGTSVTGWIICLSSLSGGSGWIELFSTATLTALIAVVGVILRMFSKKPVHVHIGNILLGFAVLMFGMSSMSGAVAPLRDSQPFISVLTSFSSPLLGILVGILFTSILQSASAAVGILQALTISGAVTFSVALPLIMGIAIGAAVPVLLSALGANTNGRRTSFIYLLIDILGALIWSLLFYALNAVLHFSFMSAVMTTVTVAALNTLFRFATVILLLPFTGALEKLVCRFIPEKASPAQSTVIVAPLEERFVRHPALAIEQCSSVINAMAVKSQENLAAALSLLANYSDEGFSTVESLEETVDVYEDRLGTYLMKLTGQEMTKEQSGAVSKFLHTISDFERISDHALNIAEVAREIHEKRVVFSPAAAHELQVIGDAVSEIVALSMRAFMQNDLSLAKRVEPLEELIDTLCDEMKLHHVDRLQQGVCTLHQGFVFNDLLTNYERVSDHCSNIAVAMIELDSDAFDTHEYINSLKEMKSDSFDRYLEEYARRFAL